MTNKERLLAYIGFQPQDNVAEAALLDAGIDGSADYDVSLSDRIKRCAIEVMEVVITTADTGSSMTGWTAKFDRPSILKRIATMKADLGISEVLQPEIRRSCKW